MKTLVVFGTRPEAIKLAPVIREMKRREQDTGLQTVVCVTAQHREMLDQVIDLFGLPVDHDLDLMQEDQTPTRVASSALAALEPVLAEERPDWVMVQGDTTTAAVVSMAAFYAKARVAHVEAGLRTHDKWSPFPEETNRRIAGVIADLHFAPTDSARQNLLREGIAEEQVLVTGNPVIDALREVVRMPVPHDLEALLHSLSRGHRTGGPKLILVTAHRRESFGAPLEEICLGLKDFAQRFGSQVHVVYPVHPNPNVSTPVHRILDGVPNITLRPPLDYLSLAHLMKRAHLILTDSGGIQEEAPALGKPVLVLREVTERPEAVSAGTAKVIGTDRDRIVSEAAVLIEDPAEYMRMARAINPYGDGRASHRIVAGLLGERVDSFIPQKAGEGRPVATETLGA